jgi:hypothetical protein
VKTLQANAITLQAAERAWQRTAGPHARVLEAERSWLAAQIGDLEDAQQARADFISVDVVAEAAQECRRSLDIGEQERQCVDGRSVEDR